MTRAMRDFGMEAASSVRISIGKYGTSAHAGTSRRVSSRWNVFALRASGDSDRAVLTKLDASSGDNAEALAGRAPAAHALQHVVLAEDEVAAYAPGGDAPQLGHHLVGDMGASDLALAGSVRPVGQAFVLT